MRNTLGTMFLTLLCVGLVSAQAAAPKLSEAEALLVQSVMALQQTATAACEALPAVKTYQDVLRKVNAQLKTAGKAVDWRTGAPAVLKPEVP